MDATNTNQMLYKRVLLKLSGEAFQGESHSSIDSQKLEKVSYDIKEVVSSGVELAIVLGAGNLVRGVDFKSSHLSRVTADQMGMIATIINGLALKDSLNSLSIPVKLMSALEVPGVVEKYNSEAAKNNLTSGFVNIFVGGTGNPLVTTDTAAALRAVEISADILMKATKVNGVFSEDPIKNPDAKRYETLSYKEAIEKRLGVMDLSAIIMCQDNNMPLRVFNMSEQNALVSAISNKDIGTLVESGEKNA